MADKKTILIVDDETQIREQIRVAFEYFGYDVLEAEDGTVGLRQYEQFRPDLVVSDIYMPKMNGLMLFRSIRRINKSAKVILITAYSHYEQIVDSELSKPDGFFEKPFRLSDLMKQVKILIDQQVEACEDSHECKVDPT